ncbi:MAG: malonate decarboxylase holo-[acyl-carrier-protein] synthase [Anaeromyxobacteraceae bacterium]
MTDLARHDWVRLREGWPRGLLAPVAASDRASLEQWLARGRPLVVARALEGDPPGSVRLGLALPGRRRIGVVVPSSAVRGRLAPPALEAALGCAPAGGARWLRELAARLRAADVEPAVYGSLAWQHVAADPALAYVTPESDVDLLVRPSTRASADAALAILTEAAAAEPVPRLDGELVLPDGAAVAWRELASTAARVLVKTTATARLIARAEVLGTFGRCAA